MAKPKDTGSLPTKPPKGFKGPTLTPIMVTPPHTPVKPFNTPDEQLNYADRFAQYQGSVYDIDNQLENQRLGTEYQKSDIDRGLAASSAQSVDNMIARGLGQSSIQQGELNDLAATATRRKSYLDTLLSTATIAAGRQKENLGNAWNAFVDWYQKMAVTNAANTPVASTTPQVQGYQPPGGANTINYKGVNGNWDTRGFWAVPYKGGNYHVYPDGHAVYVK